MKRGGWYFINWTLVLFLVACGTGEKPLPTRTPIPISPTSTRVVIDTPAPTVMPGSIGSAEKPIVFAAAPGYDANPDDAAMRDSLADTLGMLTGMTIRVVRLPSPAAVVADLASGLVDAAGMQALEYSAAEQKGAAHAGLQVAYANRSEKQPVAFYANIDQGYQPSQDIQTALSQFAGKTPCWQMDEPVGGYVVPAGMLARQGIVSQTPLWNYSEVQSVRAIYDGKCDFAGMEQPPVSFSAYKGLSDLKDVDQKVALIWASPPLLQQPVIAFASDMPRDVLELLERGLLKLAASPAGRELLAKCMGVMPDEMSLTSILPTAFDDLTEYIQAANVDLDALLAQSYLPSPASLVWAPAPAGQLAIDVALQGGEPFLPFLDNAGQPLNAAVMPAIYAQLLRQDANGEFFPYLADQTPTWANGQVRLVGQGKDQQLEVEFRLRPKLYWQDGQPLSAADLVFSWNLVMSPRWPGSHRGAVGYAPEVYVHEVTAPALDRVVFHFMSQTQAHAAAAGGWLLENPAIYADLSEQAGPIFPVDYLEVGRNVFPRHLLSSIPPEAIARSEFAHRPVFAGPYRLVEGGRPGQPVVLEAFKDFQGKLSIPRVTLGLGAITPGALLTWHPPVLLSDGLKHNAVQAQVQFPAVNQRQGEALAPYGDLAASNVAGVLWAPRNSVEMLVFNLDNPHLSSPLVRQAIAYAVNRQAIIDQALGGYGSLVRSYLPGWHPLAANPNALPGYDFNLEQALKLLRQAGYDVEQNPAMHRKLGLLTLQLAVEDTAPYSRVQIAQLLQEQLGQAGIQVEVTFYTHDIYEGDGCEAVHAGRKFDLALDAWEDIPRYPGRWIAARSSVASIPAPENDCAAGLLNFGGYRSQQASSLLPRLNDGKLAILDPLGYKESWAVHQVLWAHNLPALPLFNSQRPLVLSNRLTGPAPSPFAFGGVADTWNLENWEESEVNQ